jgi:hypothetical protein
VGSVPNFPVLSSGPMLKKIKIKINLKKRKRKARQIG